MENDTVKANKQSFDDSVKEKEEQEQPPQRGK